MTGERSAEIAGTIARLRRRAGWSQAELARRASTSQPAIARYESGTAAPSWPVLERILAALGHDLRLETPPLVDEHDVRLAEQLLELTPQERLASLARYARLGQRVRPAS